MAHIQQHGLDCTFKSFPKWRIACRPTTGFNDDFMGLKRIFAALAIIYLTAHDKTHSLEAVSYTHLTLPTNREV